MPEYSHFEKSAVCASSGYYTGRKGSELPVFTSGGTGGLFRVASGSVSASPSATIDTGLTTVTYAVTHVVGRCPATKATQGTLDNLNSPDGVVVPLGGITSQYRVVSTNDLWLKAYGQDTAGNATLDPINKRHTISWLAMGT